MDEPRWIVIPRWNDFQHYKDRRPSWIKAYTDLLNNDAYLDLTEHQALVIHRLWLMYASAGCHLHVTTASLSRHLHLRVMTRDLEALNHAGFIHFSASKPLAPRYPRLEKEKEKKELGAKAPKPVDNSQPQRANVLPKDPAQAIRTMIANGVITDPVDLEAEINGAHLNPNIGDDLRKLLQ
jgi:hypothetical protein